MFNGTILPMLGGFWADSGTFLLLFMSSLLLVFFGQSVPVSRLLLYLLFSTNGFSSCDGVPCPVQQKTNLQRLSDEYLVLQTKLLEDGASLSSRLAYATSSAKKGYGAF